MIRVVPWTSTWSIAPPALSLLTASHSTGPWAQHSSTILALPAFSSTIVMSRRANMQPWRCRSSSGVRTLFIAYQTSMDCPGSSTTVFVPGEIFVTIFANSIGSCSISGQVP